jgi:hypothetical protein
MRNPTKTPFKFDSPKALVRVGTTCYIETIDTDIDTKYKNRAQLLGHVLNMQNRYIIRPGPAVKWEQASPARREIMKNQEVEMSYREEGEQQLEPHLMNEPMYIVARSLIDRGVKQDCVLKENDVIRFGRARFRVQEIVIQEQERKKEINRVKNEARRKEWQDKAWRDARLKAKGSPRHNSS